MRQIFLILFYSAAALAGCSREAQSPVTALPATTAPPALGPTQTPTSPPTSTSALTPEPIAPTLPGKPIPAPVALVVPSDDRLEAESVENARLPGNAVLVTEPEAAAAAAAAKSRKATP